MTGTRIHPETGKVLTRQVRRQVVRFGALRDEVEVPGWYPEDGSDSIHTGADLAEKDAAVARLKAAYGQRVRQMRRKLGLTQEEAGLLIGGGPRAFQKYEAGTMAPSDAAVGLLEVLAATPAALEVLKALRAGQVAEVVAGKGKAARAGQGRAA